MEDRFFQPIPPALRLKTMHSRYGEFFDDGNAEDYRKRIEEIHRRFGDLK